MPKNNKLNNYSFSRLIIRSDILPSSDLGPGPCSLSQIGLKSNPIMTPLKKTKPNFFFSADLKTCQVFSGFKQLFTTIAWRIYAVATTC